ncbi:MAG TPA: IPT/TIG domain-containing protein [Solirubrobacteraceae bacterium]|jgi:phage gpG-like protein
MVRYAQAPAGTGAADAPAALRLLAAGTVLFLLLAALLLHGLAPRHGSISPATTGRAYEPAGLPLAARGPISMALGRDASSYRVRRASGRSAVARNVSQRLSAGFSSSGVRLRSGELSAMLRLQAVGYGTSMSTVGRVAPTVKSNRVLYSHGPLSEWYVNGPLGLEQGFTFLRRPSGPARAALTISLAVSGAVRLAGATHRNGVVIDGPGGRSLRYGDLFVTDAHGRVLPSRLDLSGSRILLHADTRGASFPVRVDPLVQQAPKVTASDEEGTGMLGYSLALSRDGSTALIGGPGDNGATGAAWVFTQSEGVWSQQGPKLTGGEAGAKGSEPCNEETEVCSFGRTVALSGDGNTALIGAPREAAPCPRGGAECARQGAAWVFTRGTDSKWTVQAKLTGGTEETLEGRFGHSVALSADGTTALVGAPSNANGVGSAWVFTRTESGWAQQGPRLRGGGEVAGNAHLGGSVSLSGDGNTALVGAPGDNGYAGAAWAFSRTGSTWTQEGPKLTGGQESGEGHFGFSTALSGDGATALVGGREDNSRAGAAWAFTLSGPKWVQQGPKLTAGPEGTPEGELGSSVALSGDGNLALIGAEHDTAWLGAAWEFSRSGSSWNRRPEKLVSPEEDGKSWFGTSVAISADASVALIGAPHDGARTGAAWPYRLASPPPPPPPPPPAPAVTSITPTSGPAAGGTQVTIKGAGFLAGATVKIGSEATAVNVVSETELTATTAASPAGSKEVVVSDERGTSSAGPAYTYIAPSSSSELSEPEEGPEPFSELGGSEVLGIAAALLPPPKLALTGNVVPAGGVVLVKLPGSKTFVALTNARQLPFGTIIDATHGRVAITTAAANGHLQTIVLYEGEFKITQSHNGVVLATLMGGNFSVCPTAAERAHTARATISRASRKHTVRKLWAEGHGSYSTKGNYAAGAVLGTRWLTVDTCGGTLIRVSTDRVSVTDLVNHHHVTVKAGHTYLAKAPG